MTSKILLWVIFWPEVINYCCITCPLLLTALYPPHMITLWTRAIAEMCDWSSVFVLRSVWYP